MIQIGGLQKLTLIDYPGKPSCTVFLIGCNFRCPFCYSKELVLPKEIKKQLYPVKSRKAGLFNGAGISEKDFFDFLKKRKGLLEGVCVTGGEPCIHKDLPQFCKKIKRLGYLVKLDTNGSNPKMLRKLIDDKLIDYVAMDIKAPGGSDPTKRGSDPPLLPPLLYEKAAGVKVNIKKIQKSIDILKKGKIDYEFRSTILPRLHRKEDVVNMAKWIQGAKVYYLQQFRPEKTVDPEYEKYNPFNIKELEVILKLCNRYVFTKLRS